MTPTLSQAKIALLVTALALSIALPASLGRAAPEPTPIAILDLAYLDTSGEPMDQTGAHRKRSAEFVAQLKQDLEASGRYRIVPLTCNGQSCASDASPGEVQKAAQKAGARLVVFTAIHKLSTLITWAKLDIAATDDSKIVFDRLLTFRGDTDNAWEKAESFGAREILRASPLLQE